MVSFTVRFPFYGKFSDKFSVFLFPSSLLGLALAPIVETRSPELAMSLLDFSS